jgi:ABC-type nickel/cobalt efflux system permease component RcnA
MRRALVVAVALALLAAPAAHAHPLGNFSINHLDVVRVSADRVDLQYILDQAEIPTFQERGFPLGQVLSRKRAEVARGVSLTVRGRAVPLRLAPGGRIALLPGAGGLTTTRVELQLSASARTSGAVVVRDETFGGRVGWKAVVVRPGRGTAVRSDVTSADPTRGLRVYPKALLATPADRRVAHLTVRMGGGTVSAPGGGGRYETTRDRGAGDGLAGVFADAAAGRGVLLFLLLAALGWGALHALSPGHGKTMVAAYLVGTRGTARHALALGAMVTVTHTIGVFALGLVTLALSAYVLPEQLYPWLSLVSGLLVVGVGAGVLRARLRQRRAHGHGHHHHHHEERITARSLVTMGASAGLIPCPSALVVLLSAIAQAQVLLGMVLIIAFSVGLATTLCVLGVAVVRAARLGARVSPSGRLIAILPAASALVIVGAGVLLTVRAIPGVTG